MGIEVAIASAIAGGAMSATGNFMAGREKSMAANFEATQRSHQEQEYKIAAAQTEARRREHLTSSLETIASIRAGRGVGEGSPTALASYDEIIGDESRDIRVERLNYLSKAEQSTLASRMSHRQAKMSLISGYLSAGADLAGTGYKVGSVRSGAPRYGSE